MAIFERPDDVKPGDEVVRMIAGVIRQRLCVTAVDAALIHCGDWTFDRKTGMEVDWELGWGPDTGVTGSYLIETLEWNGDYDYKAERSRRT
jgi:hypothetical protein